jgi:uncharacterized protein YxjI
MIQEDRLQTLNRFLVAQKHMSISQKYTVWDEHENAVLYVERPSHVARSLLAIFAAVLAGGLAWGFLGAATSTLAEGPAKNVLIIITVLAGLAAAIMVLVRLMPKRHIMFFRDEARTDRMFEVLQDIQFEFLTASFTMIDAAGQTIAKFRKNYLSSIFRKRWYCTGPTGRELFVAQEDSVVKSALRRLLGPLFGLLRTNFHFMSGERKLGEFNRKMTLLDKYALDLSHDKLNALDRRVAIAMGVMLDTAERR